MATTPSIDEPTLQALCKVLGATDDGLTGSQIGQYLTDCRIVDIAPTLSKKDRLFEALKQRQFADGCANNVLGFVMHAMSPVRFVGRHDYFEQKRRELNVVLAFCGLTLAEDGALKHIQRSATLPEAEARAGALRKALVERKIHPDVIAFCRAELLEENYFHAVFEATKSVAEKLRNRTSLTSDGARLVDEALSIGNAGHPRLAFNSLGTESEKSEHSGLMNLIKGVFGAFRNTTAHAPRIHWNISEQDALDIFTTLSLIHRRIDAAVRTHIP
jgi:uncharacterized protein (TIGR02391 family)